jgi:K+-sensing histidine kinase KdpD
VSTADERTAQLLSALARDFSHELRGPVQSILVNLEVLRRRAQNADANGVFERADVIEEEIQRLHRLADAFLALLRTDESDAHVSTVETLLVAMDPLIAMRAKSGHLQLARPAADPALLIRVALPPLQLALLRLFVGACETLSPGDTIRLAAALEDDNVVFQLSAHGAKALSPLPVQEAIAAVTDWLRATHGTVRLEPGSDTVIAIAVRFPSAVLTATSSRE